MEWVASLCYSLQTQWLHGSWNGYVQVIYCDYRDCVFCSCLKILGFDVTHFKFWYFKRWYKNLMANDHNPIILAFNIKFYKAVSFSSHCFLSQTCNTLQGFYSTDNKTSTCQQGPNQISHYKLEITKGTSNIFSFLYRTAVISVASLSIHSRALCPMLAAISSCHVTSYLLGLQGHCLSDWQSSDSTQYPNNLRAWRHSKITAWPNLLVGRVKASQRRGKKANKEEEDQDKAKALI